MARARPDAGFALPFTVFLISVLTLVLTAAFAKLDADRRLAYSSGATLSALVIANNAHGQGNLHIHAAGFNKQIRDGRDGWGDVECVRLVRKKGDGS